MMGNPMPYLRFKYGDRVIKYFTQEMQVEHKAGIWDDTNKGVVCSNDTNMKEEDNIDCRKHFFLVVGSDSRLCYT